MKWIEFFKRKNAPKTNETTAQEVENKPRFTFSEDGKSVMAEGIAELAHYSEGYDVGDGIACFTGRGDDKTMILVNTKTGKVRRILSSNGRVLVSDSEIDYRKVNDSLEHPSDVKCKYAEYHFGFYNWFKDGYAALSWTTHPDGMYYMDEDGFGMEPDSEENVYCIINTDLKIVVPFQPMDVRAVLEKFRKGELS